MRRVPIQKAPFVKILIPFVIGIICRYKIEIPFLWIIPAILGGVFLFLFYLNKRGKDAIAHFQIRHCFGIGLCFVWLLVGMLVVDVHNSRSIIAISNSQTPYLQIQLVSEHRHKNNHILFDAVLLYGIKDDSCRNLQKQKILLYFTQNPRVQKLLRDDVLLIKNNLIPIKSAGNPDEFDYAEYMKMRHINYMQFLSDEWVLLGRCNKFSIKSFAADQQTKMRNLIEQTSLTEREQDFFNAVLLGITDNLSDKQRDLFQRAGLSHLLAISGLHVGVVALIVLGLLYPLKRLGYNRVRFSCAILVLWGYAFICGLSPSVIRACIMFSILIGSNLLKRHNYPINSLAIAAFLMLVYDPFFLWDIGFQLSFLSVLLILLLTAFYKRISKNKIFDYLITLVWVTAVVQIGTTALTVYYFHSIPVYSIICNLVMVPLFPVFLSGGILLLLLGSYAELYVIDILHFLFNKSDAIISFIVNLPGAVIENIWINELEALGGIIVIFGGILFFYTRKTNYLIALLSVISLFLLLILFNPSKTVSEISVYNYRGGISINIIDYPQNYVITTDELFSIDEFEKAAQNHWMKINVYPPVLITDSFETNNLNVSLPFVQFKDKRILLLNNDSWKYKRASTRLKINLLIIGREYQGRISDITHLYEIGQVIISSDVNSIVASNFEKECDFLGLKCHNTAQAGAWMLNMDVS